MLPKFSIRAAALLLAALPGISQIVPTSGGTEFGMLGLAAGQTLRLSVVAVAPNACSAQIGFQDAAGGNYPINPSFPINSGFPINPSTPVTLGPGQGAFVDLIGSQVISQFGQRLEVHPVVVVQPPATGAPTFSCRAMVEIIDSVSGFSLGLVPGTTPSATLDFGLQGLAFGQVVRLNILAVQPGPCQVVLGFRDRNGGAVGPVDKTVNLTAGQADHLDIPGSSLVSTVGQRAEVRPVTFSVPGSSSSSSSCRATAEAWDALTRRTWAATQSGTSE